MRYRCHPLTALRRSAWAATLCALLSTAGDAALHAAREVPIYGAADGGAAILLSNANGQSPYTGIGRYLGRASCTAVFFTVFEGADAGAAPAYALTNGHCPDFPGSNEVLIDRPPGRGQVTFNFFADTTRSQLVVPVVRTTYATMKGQDIAVLELGMLHEQLRAHGVTPWPITPVRADRDEPIAVVGAPGSSFLQLSACELDGQAPVVLEYIWHWYGLLRNHCQGIAPGSSGSPAISRRTRRIVGLVNTSTNGGRSAFTECVIDHPCEPAADGETSRAETTYVTPVLGLDRCFPGGWFDPRATRCSLDPGDQVRVSPAFLGRANPRLTTVPIGRPVNAWNVTVSGPFEDYRYKVVPADAEHCRDLRGYLPTRSVAQRPLIDDPLPERDGWWFLCVIGAGAGSGGVRQPLAFPTVVVARVDSAPPRIQAPLLIEDGDQAWRVTFRTLDPEVSLYAFKFGRPADTRCQDGAGYRLALVPFLALPKSERPYLFCVIPYDAAQNPGRVIETLLP